VHRFQLGQSVAATGLNVPPGPYRITRLLPLADGMPQYHAKSLVDNHERALAENAIRTVVGRPSASASASPVRRKAAR
jgi:hypothetical protein